MTVVNQKRVVLKSSLHTLYACSLRLTFAFLALPSLLAPALDNTNSNGADHYYPLTLLHTLPETG